MRMVQLKARRAAARPAEEPQGLRARPGLRRIGTTVEVEDTPAVRGMINKVSYMVRVEVRRERLNATEYELSPHRARARIASALVAASAAASARPPGRGHKGQKSRSGGKVASSGFEGGQMPLQKRLPKYGFTSRIARTTAQVRLAELNKVDAEVIDLAGAEGGRSWCVTTCVACACSCPANSRLP
jgi:hypothetical protein